MKNTFTCLCSIILVLSGLYGCRKAEPQQQFSAVPAEIQSGTAHSSLNPNPGALHNRVVWTYMSAHPEEQAIFTKMDVLQMIREVLTIMADEGYYEGHLDEPGALSSEMLAGMEAMGYFTGSGYLKNSQELKELRLYVNDDDPLQKVINKINLKQSSTVADFILAAKSEMNTLDATVYAAQVTAFNSIIDSSAAMTPRFVNFALPTIFLPSASNLRIAYADAKGYTEGTRAAQNQGKNTVQQDIWGMTYSTTRSVQQFKRELGL